MRKICVVTGSRAEYGHLRGLLAAIEAAPECVLQLVVTGTHLSDAFGMTIREIEEDGFTADWRIELLLNDDTPVGVAQDMSAVLSGMGSALASLAPDLLVVLGDRYEIAAASLAAVLAGIPIAHIHGGELTEGAIDDVFRHAITKMAHLHFVAAEPYAKRVIQLGEAPSRVFTVGTPGLDSLIDSAAGVDALRAATGWDGSKKLFLVTMHPETVSAESGAPGAGPLIEALKSLSSAHIVITGVNADPDHVAIEQEFRRFVDAHSSHACYVESLGRKLYGAALLAACVVIGNSSSGLIEAPVAKTPTVNIGDRQKGRLRAASVVDCRNDAADITAAISQALDPEFAKNCVGTTPPYGSAGASARIVRHLAELPLAGLTKKKFHDLPAVA